MATDSNTKPAPNKMMDPTSPYYINPSADPNTPLVLPLLNGDNYSTWVRSARQALKAKDKMGFVDGTLQMPAQSHEDFRAWDKCNNLVASWIYYSLDKSLQAGMAFVDNAQLMWNELQERYSQGNAQRAHQLKKEIWRLEQGTKPW